jgi:ribosomal protein S18 acetylase RimI-like enzyme
MIVPIEAQDRDWLRQFVLEHWGSDFMVSKGKTFRPHEHVGYFAALDGERVGVVTYEIRGDECEVTLLHSLKPGVGLGTALMEAVIGVAREAGCRRVWLITTNDNLNALGFYQKRGFRLVAVYLNAMEETRRLKPHIPLVGDNGIPLRDEIELEYPL